MILTNEEWKTLHEIYLVASTPGYLMKRFRQTEIPGSLVKKFTVDELVDEYNKVLMDREVKHIITAYAILVAFTYLPTEQRARQAFARVDLSELLWGEDIVELYKKLRFAIMSNTYERGNSTEDVKTTMRIDIRDSGERETFETGYQRDIQAGKVRFDLIPIETLIQMQADETGVEEFPVDTSNPPIVHWLPIEETDEELIPELVINRLAGHYHKGAQKYGRNNYLNGAPFSRMYASLLRHVYQWAAGDTGEDHLAAILWNASALMMYENMVWNGWLHEDLADMGPLRAWLDEGNEIDPTATG